MNRKVKYVLAALGTGAGIAVLVFGIKFFLDAPYRKQIPAQPDPNSLTKPVQEQLTTSTRWAYLNTTATNLGKLGMVYHSYADYKNAALCYRLAIKKDKGEWRWNYYLGYLELEQGELAGAVENFKKVTQRNPDNYLAYYYTAEAYQKLAFTDSAEQLLKRIEKESVGKPDETISTRDAYFPLKTYAKFNLARIYLNSDRLDSAELLLKEIIEEQMTFAPAYRLLGNVYTRKEDTSLAAQYTLRANDLADYTPPVDVLMDEVALTSRSDQYLLKQIDDASRSGNHHWSLTLCNHLLDYLPDNKYLISTAITENFRYGSDKKALSYLDKHFSLFVDDPRELMNMTDLLYDKGYGTESLRYFNQVKKLMPQNSALPLWLSDRGKKDEAITFMNKLVQDNPGDVKILADAIRLWIGVGENELAAQYLANLQRLAPADPEVMKVSGLMAEKKGDIKEALSFYEKAFASDPKDVIFAKQLIDVYIREKNWEQAIGHFKLALQTSPNEPTLLEGLGRLYIACPAAEFKNIPDGLLYSERAFINQSSSFDTRLAAGKSLATVYVSLGDKKKAVKFINMTISLAKQGNKSEEYTSYFSALVSKR